MSVKRALDLGIYSTYLLPATVPLATYSLFTTSIGNLGQGFGAVALTYSETNLEGSGGQLPSEVDSFVIYGVSFILGNGNNYAAAVPDADSTTVHNDLVENANLQFVTNQTKIVLGPPKLFPAGGGLVHYSFFTTAVAASHTIYANNNGDASAKAILAWKEPIIIQGGQSFSVDYVKTGAAAVNAAAYRITVKLHGHTVARVNN